MNRVLRPDFDKIPSLRSATDQIDSMMEELTEEQLVALDYVAEWPRLLFVGGAGTGKTFLAVEAARRHASEGQSVTLLCPRPELAAFLRPRIEDTHLDVVTLDDVAEKDRREVLIVDEAQDLMNLDDIEVLDSLVDGGLERGVWRFFLDPNRQHSVVGRFDPDAMDLLSGFGAHKVPLTRNCRNTPQIVSQTQLYTGGDLGTAIAGDGPPVDFVDVGERDEAETIRSVVTSLFDDDIPPGQITLLTPASIGASAVTGTRMWKRGQIRVVDVEACAAWPVDSLTVSTIDRFKGLENRFIILVDLDLLAEGERGVNQLYVGMSRARAGLMVVLSDSARARLSELAETILAKAESVG